MADLASKIVSAADVTVYDRATGKAREITRVTYRLGELGPFVADFEKALFSDSALDLEMDAKRRALERHA